MYLDLLHFEGRGNLYRFNYNNPCGYVDKDGRQIAIPITPGMIVIGGIAVSILTCEAIPSCRSALQALGKAVVKACTSKPPETCPKTGEMDQAPIGKPGDPGYLPAMKICVYTCPKQGVVRRYFPEGTQCEGSITQPWP